MNGTQIASDQQALTPSIATTSAPSIMPTVYHPGDLVSLQHGLLLSRGLRTRVVATSGEPVAYSGTLRDPTLNANTTSNSSEPLVFHGRPDFGATFADERPWNVGGWIYTSNSEMEEQGKGGVGAITFDKDGNIIDYRMVLTDTTMNCAGGRTPWYVK
jgi:uncharacterized protein